MTPEQLSAMNTWLAVIGIASVIQVAALAVMAVVGYRLCARTLDAIDNVQEQIEPVKRRVNEVLDNVNQEVVRLRRVGDRVEDSVTAVKHGVSAATSVVKSAVIPGWAVTKGLLSAVSAFTGRNAATGRPSGRSARQQIDETRFVNEGGNDARDEDLRF